MSTPSLLESVLLEGFRDLRLYSSPEQVSAFMSYLQELKRWNKAYNLTSLKTDRDIVIRHFIDSLLYLKALPEGEIDVMDVGSGAGFPGIPLKIVRPEIRLYLVEPSWKKAGFLMHIVKTLVLEGVEVIEKRVEDISGIRVDVVLTRALFGIKDFYKKACPLLKTGGRLVLSKGPKVDKEIGEIKKGLKFEVLKLRLPLTNIYRYIILIYPEGSAGLSNQDLENNSEGLKTDQSTTRRNEKRSIKVKPEEHRDRNICFNLNCRLRKAGCRGFEGCPGFNTRA